MSLLRIVDNEKYVDLVLICNNYLLPDVETNDLRKSGSLLGKGRTRKLCFSSKYALAENPCFDEISMIL